MTSKNKLGWFIVFMFSVLNIGYATKNYIIADNNHVDNINCMPVDRGTERLWDHLTLLESGHIVVTFTLTILIALIIAAFLIDSEEEDTIAPATVEKE